MPPAYEVLLLNTAIPQIQAAQSGDTYVVPRDIAFSAALTLSAGTANGVPYLNGSKVLTTGSALATDGASYFNFVGSGLYPLISVAPTGNNAIFGFRMDASAGNGRDWRIEQGRNAVGQFNITDITAGNTVRYSIGSDGTAIWNVGAGTGSEQMRLTSTGLGIGTSSVTNPLTIVSATATTKLSSSTTTNQAYHSVTNASGNMYFGINNSANSFFAAAAYAGIVWHDGAYPIVFGTSNTERMRLDSSGNLGLGVTPSAWGSNYRVLDIVQFGTRTASLVGGSGQTGIGLALGVYHNSTNWIATVSSAPVARYEIDGVGNHSFFTYNGTVTAGATISFTQAMTLDASGRLLVGGTTASNTIFRADRSNSSVGDATVNSVGHFVNTYDNNTNGSTAYPVLSLERLGASGISNGSLFEIGLSRYSTASTDAYTQANFIVRDGNSSSRTTIATFSNNLISFSTGSTERARITSGGAFVMGTSPSSGAATNNNYLTVRGDTDTTGTNYTAYILYNNANLVFGLKNDGYVRADGIYSKTSGSAANVYVDSDGLLYRSTSSLKYKTDVHDASHGLAEVMQLRSVMYKSTNENDGETIFGGLIAEEVHAAGLTEFVQYAPDGSPDALAYGNMVSLLVKAIQEQQAMINELKAEVAALKGA